MTNILLINFIERIGMKKLCIFDFDGTLFNSLDDVADCFNATLQKLGFLDSITDDYINAVGGNIYEIIRIILGNNATEENIQKVKETYEVLYNNDPKANTKPYDGMKELLTALNEKNIILAINSNRNPDSINYFLNRYLGDIDFLDIQGHVPTNPSKPDPYGVNTIIEKAEVGLDDAIYIGDSITDIKTAENADIDCVLVDWGYGLEEVYDNSYPLKIVSSPDEIMDIVLN